MKNTRSRTLLFAAAMLFLLCICSAEDAKRANASLPQGFECQKIDKPYVHIPIRNDAPEVKLIVKIDGEQPYQSLTVRLAQDTPEWNGMISVEQWMGKKLTIVPEAPLPASGWIRNVKMSDQLPDQDSVYKEKYRPQFHFAAQRGWINDVNGPIYMNGVYHLPFQHAPWRMQDSGDKVWSHAVSKDLIHWQEIGPMLSLTKSGSSWSGSSAIDWYNTAGLVKNPIKDKDGRLKNPAMVAFTNHGSMGPFNVVFFYSLDSGRTWTYHPGNPVIPQHSQGNRDAHVLWYEDKANPANSHWVLVLYSGGGEDYLFYASKDLLHWEMTSQFNGAGGGECPDFYQIPLDGDKNNMKWLFWCGNGNYSLGSFDGKAFKKESGPFRSTYSGDKSGRDYGSQTFADIPPEDGRRINIAWMAGGQFPGMPFTQQLTIPRVLTLRTTPDGPRLFVEPVKEIEILRTAVSAQMSKPLDGTDMQLQEEKPIRELVDIEAVFTINKDTLTAEGANQFGLEVNGQRVTCVLDKDNNRDKQKMAVLDSEGPLGVVDGKVKLRVIVDRMSIEVFANDGAVQICRNFVPPDNPRYAIKVFGKKGLADVELKAHQLQSIWKKK